jgi:hypothetical protein
MKYKIIGFSGTRQVPKPDFETYGEALHMKETYGLPFTVEQIIETWSSYSDRMCAGWLIDDKESVEDAFGVVLEPVED